jgi:hypothetical protein
MGELRASTRWGSPCCSLRGWAVPYVAAVRQGARLFADSRRGSGRAGREATTPARRGGGPRRRGLRPGSRAPRTPRGQRGFVQPLIVPRRSACSGFAFSNVRRRYDSGNVAANRSMPRSMSSGVRSGDAPRSSPTTRMKCHSSPSLTMHSQKCRPSEYPERATAAPMPLALRRASNTACARRSSSDTWSGLRSLERSGIA